MKQVVQFPILQPTARHARVGFETIPANLSRAELFRYFTFPEPDRREIAQCRGESNNIGFTKLRPEARCLAYSVKGAWGAMSNLIGVAQLRIPKVVMMVKTDCQKRNAMGLEFECVCKCVRKWKRAHHLRP